jgi:hypothetical protein
MAPVKGVSGKWGYIDKNGDLVISPRVRVDNPTGENPYRGFIKKNGSFYYDPILSISFKNRKVNRFLYRGSQYRTIYLSY